jgi:ATP-binding cassette subfamily C protein
MNHIKAFMWLTQSAPKKLLMIVLILMVIGIFTESFGLLLLIPLLEVLSLGSNPINTKPGMLDMFRSFFDQAGIAMSIESLLLLFICLAALRGVVQIMREKLSSQLQHAVIDNLRLRCFKSILSVEWRWFLNTKSADHGSLLLNHINRIGAGLHAALSLIVTLGAMAAYFMTAAFISLKLTLIAISSAVFVYLLLHKQRDKVLTLGRGLTKSNQALFSNVQESLASIKLAKILGSEDLQFTRMKQTLHQLSVAMLSFVES